MIDAAKLDRLPAWARFEIERLQADLASTKKNLRAAFGETPTNIEIERYYDKDYRCFLHDGSTVTFTLKGGNVTVMIRDGVLEVMGDNIIQIEPRASNMIWVRVQR